MMGFFLVEAMVTTVCWGVYNKPYFIYKIITNLHKGYTEIRKWFCKTKNNLFSVSLSLYMYVIYIFIIK